MRDYTLTKMDVNILQQLTTVEKTISSIAKDIEKSIPWTSLSVKKLNKMEIVEKQKRGNSIVIKIKNNNVGISLRKLFHEEQMMNLNEIITDSGLVILPLLLKPGFHNKDLLERTDLSKSTIDHNILKWRYMGIIIKDKKTNKFQINPKQNILIEFLKYYSLHRNELFLKRECSEGVIIWQWRDEFLFSVSKRLDDNSFKEAGLTMLKDLNYNIITNYEYYYYSPIKENISLE